MAMGRAAKLPNGLTPKQNNFVNKMIDNMNETGELKATDAVLDVYDVDSRKTAGALASENLAKPAIKSAIEEALSRAGLTREVLADELAGIARTKPKDITGDVKLRAVVESLKLLGAYPTNKQPISGHSTVINIQSISFTEAKQRMQELHSESSELMNDTD